MRKYTNSAAFFMAAMLPLSMAAVPVQAQSQGPEKVITKYIQEGEECDRSEESENVIVVCAVNEDPYRIPSNRRNDPNKPVNQAWTEKVKTFEDQGDFGIGSCSPVGAAGALGCTTRMIDNAAAEKKNSPDKQVGLLIEEERQKRLAKIDEEAALVEAAELERASENARLAREAEELAKREAEAAQGGADEGEDLSAPPERDLPPPSE